MSFEKKNYLKFVNIFKLFWNEILFGRISSLIVNMVLKVFFNYPKENLFNHFFKFLDVEGLKKFSLKLFLIDIFLKV